MEPKHWLRGRLLGRSQICCRSERPMQDLKMVSSRGLKRGAAAAWEFTSPSPPFSKKEKSQPSLTQKKHALCREFICFLPRKHALCRNDQNQQRFLVLRLRVHHRMEMLTHGSPWFPMSTWESQPRIFTSLLDPRNIICVLGKSYASCMVGPKNKHYWFGSNHMRLVWRDREQKRSVWSSYIVFHRNPKGIIYQTRSTTQISCYNHITIPSRSSQVSTAAFLLLSFRLAQWPRPRSLR